MKPRVIKSYKILAAALTVVSVPAFAEESQSSPMGVEHRPLQAAASEIQEPSSVPVAVAPTDEDGYPLVGNLIRKGERPRPEPSPAPPKPAPPKPKPAPAPAPSR